MKKIILFIILSLSIPLIAQENSNYIVKGKIYSSLDSIQLLGVKILNENTKMHVSSNYQGEFKLKVSHNDVLSILAEDYEASKIKINKHHLQNRKLVIFLDDEIGLIEEVIYYELKLTGILGMDASLIQKESNKTSKVAQMGISYFKGQPKYNEATNSSLELISDIISGDKQRKRRLRSFKKKEKNSDKLLRYFTMDYFTMELRIPDNHIDNFLEFCLETTSISELLKQNNFLDIKIIMQEQSLLFLEKWK